MEWLMLKLADWLGVEPARSGEAIVPRIRFEQPWPQWLTLLVIIGGGFLVVWLYRREGRTGLVKKMILATLRIALVLLVVFMLSEAVLSVERTGLPNFVILWDTSASQQIVDHPSDPKIRSALAKLAREGEPPAGRKTTPAGVESESESDPERAAIARGVLLKDDAKLLRELAKRHKVRIYGVSGQAASLVEIDRPEDVTKAVEALRKVEAGGDQSRLGAGVKQVLGELRGVAPSAIVYLGDGQTTDDETLARAAEFSAKKGVPIFSVGIGDPEPPRDLALGDLVVDDVAFVDDLIRFQARLSSRGYNGQEVVIRLKQKTGPADSPGSDAEELAAIRVAAPPDNQLKPIEIGHRPQKTGTFTYILEVDAKPREIQLDNNRLVRAITVRKEKLRVLLVDSEPRFEYRYMKNCLDRDETVQLAVVLLSSDPEYSEQDRSALPTFPAGKEELFGYDVVVIGDMDPSTLTPAQMTNLNEFVTQKGGGVIFIAGELFNPLSYKNTPLEQLLPIDLTEARNPSAVQDAIKPFRPRLTPEGRSSPIFRLGPDEASSMQIWERLPTLYWYFEAPNKKPTAMVLAEHPEVKGAQGPLPLILSQFVGAGRTMFSAVDGTWRWRMRTGDRYFGRYWVQTLRFLSRSKLLGQKQAELSVDRRRYQRGQSVRIRVHFPNPSIAPENGEATVQVERKGEGPRTIKLKATAESKNILEGALNQPREGEYTVKLLPPPVLKNEVPSASFLVEPPAGELERLQLNRAELFRAAELTGGKVYSPENSDSLLKDLPKAQKVPLDTDPPIPLWNNWLILGLFFAIITVEWVARKRLQMA